jgi:hypothetical protein
VQWRTQEFFSAGGVQLILLRREGRENGDLGAVVPYSGAPLNLQMSETRILIRLLRMYFPWNREFSSALSKLQNFEGPPMRTTAHVKRIQLQKDHSNGQIPQNMNHRQTVIESCVKSQYE